MDGMTIKTWLEIFGLSCCLISLCVIIFYFAIQIYSTCKKIKNLTKRIGLYSEYGWIVREKNSLFFFQRKPIYDSKFNCYLGAGILLPYVLAPSIKVMDSPKRVKVTYMVEDASKKDSTSILK